jgi:pSer/pThr/pTyr-binding forkhead associated (FHA) protein
VLPGAGAGGTAPDPAPSVPESEEITRITRARQQRTPARLPSPEPVDEAPPLALEIHLPGGVLETVALRSGTYLVGRSPSSQIVIDHETLSRSHARIDVEGQSARVLDLDSTNHTFVEGQRTCGAVDVPVGGAVRFGAIETKLVRTGREARNTPKVR